MVPHKRRRPEQNRHITAAGKKPGYLELLQSGELAGRAGKLCSLLSACRLCPWRCGADRTRGETGRCGAGNTARVAKAVAHFGEEPPVSGTRGSGTIFFSRCNLRCCFCQNYQISHEALGEDVSVEALKHLMLGLQEQGCHNISLVSASHYLPFAIQALLQAAQEGLALPVVYNSNGYEDAEVLSLLEGIINIYLPDAKYGDDGCALKYSGAADYTAVNRRALDEMFRQAGYLELDENGIALRGLIVRHLVLPGGLAGTGAVLTALKQRFGRFLAVSLMGQYSPCFRAAGIPELSTRVSGEDYRAACGLLESLAFENGWVQDPATMDESFLPDFRKKDTWR